MSKKRKIIAYVQQDAKGKNVRSEDSFHLFTSDKNGGTYCICILAPFYDEGEDCFYPSVGEAVWGDKESLEESLAIGRKILWTPPKDEEEA